MNRCTKPNIILFLADDMGFSDLGCFGSEIPTPHIDKLAAYGLRYTQMYSNARCCPSRASLLTGLYPHQAGIGHMTADEGTKEYQGYLNDHCLTLAEGLKECGYHTGMVGKWHVGGEYGQTAGLAGRKGYPTPMQRGFERFYGTLEGAGSYYNPVTLMENGERLAVRKEEKFYYTDKIAEKSCEYIEEFSKEAFPYFLYVAFTAPHWPLHASEEDIRIMEGKYLAGWDAIRRARYKKQMELGIIDDIWEMAPRDEEAISWENVKEKEWEDIKMSTYAAQVIAMDRAVGKIVERVRQKGEEDNTIFLFLSDNGACAEDLPSEGWIMNFADENTLEGRPVSIGNESRRRPGGEDTYISYGLPWANASNTPFRLFKHWIHEGGIAAPFIIQWKSGIRQKGVLRKTSLHFIDIFPTLLELAGGTYPETRNGQDVTPLEGESFVKSFNESTWEREKPIFWEHEGNCGMRFGQYKLVRKYPGPFELYDMKKDRTELNDISKNCPELTKKMIESFQLWAQRVGVRDVADGKEDAFGASG